MPVIKSHGSTLDGTYLRAQNGMSRPYAKTEDEMTKTNGNGILLLRNPYRAIYGNRYAETHMGYADASELFGPGMNCVS